jgi:hypothetical protein
MNPEQTPKYLSTGAILQLNANPTLNTTIKVDLVLQITKIEDLPEKKESAQKLKKK